MVLFANFGDKEHVFSPVSRGLGPMEGGYPYLVSPLYTADWRPLLPLQVRRQFHAYTSSLFNLSESEQSIMGLPFEDPVRKTPKKAVLPERSNWDLVDKMGKGTAGPMNGEATIRGRFV